MTERHFMSESSLTTRNCEAAMPCSSECAWALITSRSVERQHAGDPTERADTVGRHDGDQVALAAYVDRSDRHPCQRLVVGEEPPRHLGRVAATEHVTHPGDEFVDELFLPRPPRRRTGGERVGLGQRMEQLESLDRADRPRRPVRSSRRR